MLLDIHLICYHNIFVKTDSSNSSAESDAENSDSEEIRQNNLLAAANSASQARHSVDSLPKAVDSLPKDPIRDARKYNQRYNLLMERISAINQVQVDTSVTQK